MQCGLTISFLSHSGVESSLSSPAGTDALAGFDLTMGMSSSESLILAYRGGGEGARQAQVWLSMSETTNSGPTLRCNELRPFVAGGLFYRPSVGARGRNENAGTSTLGSPVKPGQPFLLLPACASHF